MYRFIRRGFVLSLTITLLVACGGAPSSVTPPPASTPAPPPVAELSAERTALAEDMLIAVNELRTTVFLCPTHENDPNPPEPITEPPGAVALNDRLIWAAIVHSIDMAEHDLTNHNHIGSQGDEPSDRIEDQGYDWRAIGENVAWGKTSVQHAMKGWQESPDHCTNIMDSDFTEMGAAVTENEETGQTYWVQVFAAPR